MERRMVANVKPVTKNYGYYQMRVTNCDSPYVVYNGKPDGRLKPVAVVHTESAAISKCKSLEWDSVSK